MEEEVYERESINAKPNPKHSDDWSTAGFGPPRLQDEIIRDFWSFLFCSCPSLDCTFKWNLWELTKPMPACDRTDSSRAAPSIRFWEYYSNQESITYKSIFNSTIMCTFYHPVFRHLRWRPQNAKARCRTITLNLPYTYQRIHYPNSGHVSRNLGQLQLYTIFGSSIRNMIRR